MAIEYPISVSKVTLAKGETLEQVCSMGPGKCGDMVSVRPCGDQYENKTFLGIMLGDLALAQSASFNEKTGELTVRRTMHNPAMFVPELNEVIYGCGSWWGIIDSAEKLHKITDADIDNVWYVKALKQLDSGEKQTAQ